VLEGVRERERERERGRESEWSGVCVCFGPKLMTGPNNIIKFNALIFHGLTEAKKTCTHRGLSQINHKHKFYHFISAR